MGNVIEDWCEANKDDPDCWSSIQDFKRNEKYFAKKLNDGDNFHLCKLCGMPEFATYYHKEKLIKEQLCFSCDFWKEKLTVKGMLVIKGAFYRDGGNSPKEESKYLGFGGRKFTIKMLDGSKEWQTNNLWTAGDCPKRFRPEDNAEFIQVA
ncbi:hypothetical protein [Pantoea agglomerans]|uniref:hypothetical protein n=1 Tax=Enterobacter agglomerans TaxID=549 RepID=UPI0013CBA16C|nr:hypothetical protein [Pantoea agglomerans]NEG58006.1 hypothetical protein [Pantoea agglomerans]NEH04318.1 hypothetical protein [Pantoea agglomerans]NEH14279.1 hypothetical protein [Pantoea agglomerans]